jgi:hypothetical protein
MEQDATSLAQHAAVVNGLDRLTRLLIERERPSASGTVSGPSISTLKTALPARISPGASTGHHPCPWIWVPLT